MVSLPFFSSILHSPSGSVASPQPLISRGFLSSALAVTRHRQAESPSMGIRWRRIGAPDRFARDKTARLVGERSNHATGMERVNGFYGASGGPATTRDDRRTTRCRRARDAIENRTVPNQKGRREGKPKACQPLAAVSEAPPP